MIYETKLIENCQFWGFLDVDKEKKHAWSVREGSAVCMPM